jgi:hypothetical protein
LQFTYPYASIKEEQATEEAFSPPKRTSSSSNMKFLNFFPFLAFLDPDPDSESGSGSTDLNESGSGHERENVPAIHKFFSHRRTGKSKGTILQSSRGF